MSVSVPPQIDRSDIQGNVLRAYGNMSPCTATCSSHSGRWPADETG